METSLGATKRSCPGPTCSRQISRTVSPVISRRLTSAVTQIPSDDEPAYLRSLGDRRDHNGAMAGARSRATTRAMALLALVALVAAACSRGGGQSTSTTASTTTAATTTTGAVTTTE